MLTHAMEEKLRERIAKEKLHNNKFALAVSWVFFATVFVFFCVFFGRMGEFGTKLLSLS